MSDSQGENARLRAAFAATAPGDAPTADCPPADRLWEAMRGNCAPDELRTLLEHVASCTVCTESWRLGREMEREERPSWVSGWRVASAAAAVLAVVTLGIAMREMSPGPPGSVARTADERALELTSGTEPIARSQCLLTWTPFDQATYDVVVSTASLVSVSEANGLERPQYLVPEASLEGIASGASMMILVKVRDSSGSVVESRTLEFQIE